MKNNKGVIVSWDENSSQYQWETENNVGRKVAIANLFIGILLGIMIVIALVVATETDHILIAISMWFAMVLTVWWRINKVLRNI